MNRPHSKLKRLRFSSFTLVKYAKDRPLKTTGLVLLILFGQNCTTGFTTPLIGSLQFGSADGGSVTTPFPDPLNSAYAPPINTNPSDYPSGIWITDGMQKVRRDNGVPGTQHWGTFYGTQNEFVDFQVHLHDTGNGTPNLTVSVSNFVKSTGPGGNYTISNATKPPPNVTVYREAYVNVYPTVSNTASNTFYKSTGYYPDILIPTVDPYWGQTTNAWPFNVAAGNNQSAWVDVLIPPEAPSGYYLGSVTVTSGSTTLAKMPVTLAVWQWPAGGKMPSTPTLKTRLENWTYNGLCLEMYNPGASSSVVNCTSYPGSNGSNDWANTQIWLDATLLSKDHRYPMTGAQNVFPEAGSFSTWASTVGPLLTGNCLTHGGSGSTCPILAGSTLTGKTVDHLATDANPTAEQAVYRNWQSYFDSQGWGSLLYDGGTDEPHELAAFQTWVASANLRKSFLTPGIPYQVTQDLWWGTYSQTAANTFSTSVCNSNNCVQNAVDIIAPTIYYYDWDPSGGTTPAQTPALYTNWLSGQTDSTSRSWFMYQACTSAGTCNNGYPGPSGVTSSNTNGWNYPNYNIDGMPAANRAMEWLSFLHGNNGELYYAGEVCNSYSYHQYCTPQGTTWDPWNGVYYSGGWGDGTLVYTGCVGAGSTSAVCYMGPGVTIGLVLPSLRLKLIRDGVQDYEYLNVLTNAGQGALVQTQISSWITNSYTFDTTGTGLQKARTAVGTAMHGLTYPQNVK